MPGPSFTFSKIAHMDTAEAPRRSRSAAIQLLVATREVVAFDDRHRGALADRVAIVTGQTHRKAGFDTYPLLALLAEYLQDIRFGKDSTCGMAGEPAGTVNVSGCATLDRVLTQSGVDIHGRRFELWCIDGSYFGFRMIEPGDEKWLGVCPYNGGINRAFIERSVNVNDPSEFIWQAAWYRSTDSDIPGLDDDGDGKSDRVDFHFEVATCDFLGDHSEDRVVVDDEWWTRNEGDDQIPGDPNSTTRSADPASCESFEWPAARIPGSG